MHSTGFLKRYILEHASDDWILDMFSLAIYNMVIFPKMPEHVKAAIVDLFE